MLAGVGVAKADCDYGDVTHGYSPTESQDQAGYDLALSYAEARADANVCDTNYGEVIRVRGGFEAYCVPDDVAEGCIDVSSLLDCSLMSASACDEVMGSMFEACLTLQAGAR